MIQADRRAPYAEVLRLLFADLSPQEAAECVRPLILHTWEEPVRLPDSAPCILQRIWDEVGWQRFAADNPITRQLVGIHFLYRAAGHLGPEGCEASLGLMELARRGLRDVLLIWLGARDCPRCVRLRNELEQERERVEALHTVAFRDHYWAKYMPKGAR